MKSSFLIQNTRKIENDFIVLTYKFFMQLIVS